MRPAHTTANRVDDGRDGMFVDEDPTLSVAEAARLLGRDRTRVYALLRSGDLMAAEADDEGGGPGPLRIDRSSVERWLVAGGDGGRPLSPRNAWALIGLASGDQPFSEQCVGLLEHAEELSRTRARLLAKTSWTWRHACADARRSLFARCRPICVSSSSGTPPWCAPLPAPPPRMAGTQ
ncbi:MAG: helix-turn-helix domain-containing protein [Chloroflexi bacterium]|nr:helix-turn-helix domain-containing protein [Chloroflexota bacterium]